MRLKFSRKTSEKTVLRRKKKVRVRARVIGSTERPRLSVYKSLKALYAQVIDDSTGTTLVSSSTIGKKGGATMTAAEELGKAIAEAALAKKVTSVVFDRNGYLYHGKVKVLAEAARKAGLQF